MAHSLRLLNLRRDFPTSWSSFLNPTVPSTGNLFEFSMERSLFPRLGQEKTLKITSLGLFARCKVPGSYTVELTTPSTTAKLALSASPNGGLYVAQKDALDIEVTPTAPPAPWKFKLTRSDGGNLQAREVAEVFLVLWYETE